MRATDGVQRQLDGVLWWLEGRRKVGGEKDEKVQREDEMFLEEGKGH